MSPKQIKVGKSFKTLTKLTTARVAAIVKKTLFSTEMMKNIYNLGKWWKRTNGGSQTKASQFQTSLGKAKKKA